MSFDFDMDSMSPIESGGGVTPSGGKYQLLQRIKDDNNNEIGTVSGFFTDANDVEYAVVCLDGQYRTNDKKQWSSSLTAVTDMPLYTTMDVYSALETATENTTLILASSTSTACTYCRNNSFMINKVLYYGQLPNLPEMLDIAKHYKKINQIDGSGTRSIRSNQMYWSSTQHNTGNAKFVAEGLSNTTKSTYAYVIPILELPNQ